MPCCILVRSSVDCIQIVLGTIIQCGLSMVCAIYYLCIDFAHPTGISEATPPVASKGVKTRRILHQILKALSVTQWILGMSQRPFTNANTEVRRERPLIYVYRIFSSCSNSRTGFTPQRISLACDVRMYCHGHVSRLVHQSSEVRCITNRWCVEQLLQRRCCVAWNCTIARRIRILGFMRIHDR